VAGNFLRDESRFSVAIRDPVWKHIWLTPELRDITQTEPFLRLYRIKQLGPTEYVYPGATHTRAAHSIGVYHVALKLLRVLVARGADDWVTGTGATSFLAGALLHDLGHFPFTHSLKELNLEDHERLTASLILEEPLRTKVAVAGADPEMTAAIVDATRPPPSGAEAETQFFRHLLSGVLDPDKLDYLNRDAYCCGVPYGIQDTDFILSRVLPDRERGIVIDTRTIMSIESILFSKYLMYRAVYWHKQVRVATAMMKKTLYAALERGLIAPEQLYAQDDQGIFTLLDSLDFPEKELSIAMRSRNFYQILAELPFDENNAACLKLENLDERKNAEEQVASLLSTCLNNPIQSRNVIIDIPESISFESNLYVSDEHKNFCESSTVFSKETVKKFSSSLRLIRIAFPPEQCRRADTIPDLTEKLAKCLQVGYTHN
jgi:HD superfamily phosphohydrolase